MVLMGVPEVRAPAEKEPRGCALLPFTKAARVVLRGKQVPIPSYAVLGGRGGLPAWTAWFW